MARCPSEPSPRCRPGSGIGRRGTPGLPSNSGRTSRNPRPWPQIRVRNPVRLSLRKVEGRDAQASPERGARGLAGLPRRLPKQNAVACPPLAAPPAGVFSFPGKVGRLATTAGQSRRAVVLLPEPLCRHRACRAQDHGQGSCVGSEAGYFASGRAGETKPGFDWAGDIRVLTEVVRLPARWADHIVVQAWHGTPHDGAVAR
jgi:hypothetical protein